MSPLHFQSERVAETALLESWFWASLDRFVGIRGIFCSPEDSMLTHDELSFQWYVQRQKERTLGVELLGRNTATLHFKTETVAETALRASWFWLTSARFPGTWGIFSSLGDSKLTPDGHGLQWNLHSTSFWMHTFEFLDRNRAPLHLKTERVAETDLRASWFWATSPRFAGT